MGDLTIVLRRAQDHRPGDWGPGDCDVLDGQRDVGRIFRDDNDMWFWGVSFMLTHRKSYGTAESREGGMAAFKAEYEKWKERRLTGRRTDAAAGRFGDHRAQSPD